MLHRSAIPWLCLILISLPATVSGDEPAAQPASSPVHLAPQTEASGTPSGDGTSRMLKMTRISLDRPIKKPMVPISTMCKDGGGYLIRPDAPAFHQCLIDAQTQQLRDTGAGVTVVK